MRLQGLGIDLVNLTRMREFLRRHPKNKILRLFSSSEKKRYQKRAFSALTFARIFAAKEAFFKTLGEPWMGIEGFSSMEVSDISKSQFKIRLVSGPLAAKGERAAQGTFFSSGKLLGAQVLRWDS